MKRNSLTTSMTAGDGSSINLDALDDLVSLDSDVAISAGSSSRRLSHVQSRQNQQQERNTSSQPQLPDYNPIGLTIGEAFSSKTSEKQTWPPLENYNSSSPRSKRQNLNAVHMHVQENAKVPTLNLAVDRSGSSLYSSRPSHHVDTGISSTTKRDIEEMIDLEVNGNKNRTGESDDNNTTDSLPVNFSMAELFLSKESSHRRSLDMNYDNLGMTLSEFGFEGSDRARQNSLASASVSSARSAGPGSKTNDETQMEIDALTAAIDPTPLSEIRAKIEHRNCRANSETVDTKQVTKAKSTGDGNTSKSGSHNSEEIIDTTIATNHPHHYSYYPYGRHHQLPIPQKVPSPTGPAPATPLADPTVMTDAVATAAAIASGGFASTSNATPVSTSTGKSGGLVAPVINDAPTSNLSTEEASRSAQNEVRDHKTSSNPSPIPSNAAPYTKAQQTTTRASNIASSSTTVNGSNQNHQMAGTTRHYQRHRGPSYSSQHHAAAHATSRGSLVAATNQKSQYGFGGNHMVPSVPAPPPSISTKPAHHIHQHGTPPPHLQHRLGTKLQPHNGAKSPPPPTSANAPPPAYAGAAYERKKQRAKDARVKLNESIERLAIAMSLAGSQSKQRSAVLTAKVTGLGGSAAKNSIRPKTLQLLEECTKEAESAKKWDRPSFVGTAASLIQALNSQCEGLVRELVALQERLDQVAGNSSPELQRAGASKNIAAATDSSSIGTTSHPEHKRSDAPGSNENDDGEISHATKRMRATDMVDAIDRSTSTVAVTVRRSSTLGESTEEQTVLALVSKWLDPASLCQCTCVSRSWRGVGAFHKDQTWLDLAVKRFGFYNVRQWTEKMQDSDHIVGGDTHMKSLYRAMNTANVMPHIQSEGILLLGESRIPGRVSGWVFMVERSNGETLRSVKRDTADSAASGGASVVPSRSTGTYVSLPVVELRIIIQNIGMANGPVVLKDQHVTIDTSTRRSSGELKEIHWDERFAKEITDLTGSIRPRPTTNQSSFDIQNELCRLDLFDAVVLKVHIHARGCSTMSRFQQRSNFTKVLVCLDGTTVPLVVPFLRDSNASQL